MADFNIFHIILLLGTIQGFILTFLLFVVKKNNQSANSFLAIFLLMLSLTMLGRFLIELSFIKSLPNFLALPDAIIFLYGPLMYIYLKKLLLKNELSKTQVLLLFLPAILFVLSEIPLLLNEKSYLKALWIKNTTYRFIIIEGTAILYNIYFLFLQFQLLLRYQKISDNNFSFRQYPSYLKVLYSFTGLTLLIWFISYLSWVFGYYSVLSAYGYRAIWLILPIITYIMGYFAMKNPEYFKIASTKNNSSRKKLVEHEKLKILNEIQTIMVQEELYKNPEFSLTVLSNKLSIDRNKLSQLINNEFHKNFNEWTNEYRINESKTLLLETNLSIKEIFYQVGFNSKSAFNRAFKNNTGTTPSDFKKK
ncbi:helix-turn-helix domain-containing protein [Hanstruepera marina]|uniref:helix-turn-helix domain-containing protein n=1 Tax=Hanstruepera marina TaxID=2873265 RepID=UPI001CA5FA28|nr:helix-turn-helix domain-containing protein [Hanstruepera marina]